MGIVFSSWLNWFKIAPNVFPFRSMAAILTNWGGIRLPIRSMTGALSVSSGIKTFTISSKANNSCISDLSRSRMRSPFAGSFAFANCHFNTGCRPSIDLLVGCQQRIFHRAIPRVGFRLSVYHHLADDHVDLRDYI